MQPKLVCPDIDAGAKPRLVAGKDALDQTVKAKRLECRLVRLDADPAVIVEHIRLFAVLMYDINQLSAEIHHETVHKIDPVHLPAVTRHVCHMELTLIDEVLRRHAITVLCRKVIQHLRADRKVIRSPVRVQLPVALTAAPDPDEIVEHGRETHHCRVRVRLAPVFHPVEHVRLCLGMHRIDLHQMLLVPVVRRVVVHGDLFPDAVRQKTHRVIVPRRGVVHGDSLFLLIVMPL